MTADPPVGVVLDAASMLAFARGDDRIAELVVETAAQGAVVGLPAVALLAAHLAARADDAARARLGVLAVLPAIRVLPMTAEVVRAVARVGPPRGDLAGVHAAWASEEHSAYYVTTDSASVPEGLPAWQVFALADHVG
jgi:hypothetical protein